jgi:hypothetical protein
MMKPAVVFTLAVMALGSSLFAKDGWSEDFNPNSEIKKASFCG